MKERVEFRVPEEHASLYLMPNEGKRLGDSVRQLEVSVDDPRYDEIRELYCQLMTIPLPVQSAALAGL